MRENYFFNPEFSTQQIYAKYERTIKIFPDMKNLKNYSSHFLRKLLEDMLHQNKEEEDIRHMKHMIHMRSGEFLRLMIKEYPSMRVIHQGNEGN